MKDWLKFYFLGFFSDKYAAEGAGRSLWNSVLSLFLAVAVLCTGLFAGSAASFGTHYENSSQFKQFIGSSLDGKNLSVSDGKLSADAYVNDFLELEEGEEIDGYGLILDTRPARTSFDDFTLVCRDADGNDIAYEEYRSLSDEGKQKYTLGIDYSGKYLDVTLRQDEYEAFLNSTESGRETLDGLKSSKDKGELTEREYADSVYIAYVKAYYPSFTSVELYGEAPTLRTYYLGLVTSGFSDKYIMVLDDLCAGSFVTDSGIAINFEGYYSKIADGAVQDAGGFIKQAFGGSLGYNYLLFFLNMFKLVPIILAVLLILAAVIFAVCRYKIPQVKTGYIGSLKIACSYLFWAAVLSFFVAFALSFANATDTVYLVTAIVFNAIVAVRSAVFLVHGALSARKDENADGNKEAGAD